MVNPQSILIALDDGHGMETPGKRTPFIKELGRSIRENEFNREVVKYMDQMLQYIGFRTLLVAPTDNDTSLNVRTKLANTRGATIYVSIHYDAVDGKFDGAGRDPEGITVFHHPNSTKGKQLAEAVSSFLKQGTPQKNRGVKTRDNLAVLTQTDMPSILTENGFMDNEREAKLMLDKSFQKEVAREHVQGICKYFGVAFKEKKEVVTVSQPKQEVSATHKAAWERAIKLGITNGENPKNPITREQNVTMLMRLLDHIQKK